MLRLEILAQELSSNPNLIKDIEKEVQYFVDLDNCALLYQLQISKVPSVHIFLCKILEMRIKKKIQSLDLTEEIQFCSQLILQNPSYQACEVYSLLGLYCWPAKMSNFMDVVISMLDYEIGYQILLSFLEKVNTNTNIDEKRRSELKKSITIIYSHIESRYKEEYSSYIISIYTELLKILPKNFDFSLVFKKAAETPEETISFIVEGFPYIDQNNIVSILDSMPVDSCLVQVLTNIKITKINEPKKVFEYVFKALKSDIDCLIPSIDFWQKIFSSKSYDVLLEPVLTETLKCYLSIDEDIKDEVDQHIFGLFSIFCKNYPEKITNFIMVNSHALPSKITANFIQKLSKAENSNALLSALYFNNPYLECLRKILIDDSSVSKLVFNLDFNDKESVKLALQVLEKHTFTSDELMSILKMCENSCLNANELKVECFLKLGIHEKFGTEWSMDNVIKYFYYLKKVPSEYSQYRDYFYSLFVRNAPFDRCFSIIEKLGSLPGQSIPDFILANIYEKMDKYPYIELCCFNNDLLGYLDNPRPYIEKEVFRFVTEWNKITDHKDYYQALKSLLTVFSAKIDMIPIIDNLIDLIQIDSCIILNKVLSIFNNYKGTYNVNKAVYYLICAYNLPNVSDSHPMISGSLTECLFREDGPMAFHNILGVDINRACEVRQQILKVSKKVAQNMVRDLIKDFKGKPFSKMFESELKVTKQDFLPPKSKEDNDYTLKDVNFV